MSVAGFYDITPAISGGYYCVDERNYLTKLSAEGEMIFTEGGVVSPLSWHDKKNNKKNKKRYFFISKNTSSNIISRSRN